MTTGVLAIWRTKEQRAIDGHTWMTAMMAQA